MRHRRINILFVFFIIFLFTSNTYSQKDDININLRDVNNQSTDYTRFADNKPGFSMKESNPGKLTLNKLTTYNAKDSGKTLGDYTPNSGFTVVNAEKGSLNFGVFSYIRYLNQKQLNETYTNTFGKVTDIKRRQDIQLNKVNIKFFGWVMDPDFRYLFYVWTSNTSLGQLSQVVVAGNLQYRINDNFNFGAGINSLPGVRSTEGNFPFWLTVDNRLIADEFFRPSYTTGLWVNGRITEKLNYYIMGGNNISQFGVDAGQLDATLKTFSGALTFFPTTGEYGMRSNFGDFENHNKIATRIAGHFTYSVEDRESQPNSDGFENVQLRVSDGSPIFTPELFGSGINIKTATYNMSTIDAGFKYKGFALEGEFYYRWLNKFTGDGLDSLGFGTLYDKGFQLMASYMAIQKSLQVYSTFSQVFGGYGNPWDTRLGINFFPWKNQAFRWNFQYIYMYKSPVGALSLPYSLGATGSIFHTDFMVNF